MTVAGLFNLQAMCGNSLLSKLSPFQTLVERGYICEREYSLIGITYVTVVFLHLEVILYVCMTMFFN